MEMLKKNVQNRQQAEIICLEDLVPENHLLRKIDRAVNFDRIYDFVEDLYCCDRNGYVLGVEVTSGNVHDSVAFDDII